MLAKLTMPLKGVQFVHELLDHRLLHLLRLLEVVVEPASDGLVARLDLAQLGFLGLPDFGNLRSRLFFGERVNLRGCRRGGGLGGARTLLGGGDLDIRGLDLGVQLRDRGVRGVSLGGHRREPVLGVRRILGECRVLGGELFEALIGSLELLGGRLQRLGELFFGRTGERGARASALRALWVEDGGRLACGRRVESVLNQFF